MSNKRTTRVSISARPESPNDVQPILEALAGLLSRFSKTDHRWVSGKNCIPGTGIFVRQVQSHPWVYKLVFYTPDDIGVSAQVDMRLLLKDRREIDGLIAGVSQFLVKKRYPELIAANDDSIDQMVEKYVKETMAKRPNIQVVK